MIAGGLGEGWRAEDGVRMQKRCTGVGQARPQGSPLTAQVAVRTPSLRVQLRHVRGAGSGDHQPTLAPTGLQLGQDGGHPTGTLPVRRNVQVPSGFSGSLSAPQQSPLRSLVLEDLVPLDAQTLAG